MLFVFFFIHESKKRRREIFTCTIIHRIILDKSRRSENLKQFKWYKLLLVTLESTRTIFDYYVGIYLRYRSLEFTGPN